MRIVPSAGQDRVALG